ncbi:hypothetical protein Ga0100231_006265 [Opitutaceae bacterium TAV4]|nr:hypothetical protein Ga0100231_006265 [Opitutaceae bacterium TAV4]
MKTALASSLPAPIDGGATKTHRPPTDQTDYRGRAQQRMRRLAAENEHTRAPPRHHTTANVETHCHRPIVCVVALLCTGCVVRPSISLETVDRGQGHRRRSHREKPNADRQSRTMR